MRRNLVLMAKSKKRGGYCVAGIDCDTGNWIRLNIKGYESIPKQFLRTADRTEPALLDIISVEVTDKDNTEAFQKENYFCDLRNLGIIVRDGTPVVRYRISEDKKKEEIFYNYSNSVNAEWLRDFDGDYYSLMIVEPKNLRFYETSNGKINASFEYNGGFYKDIRVTDLEFESDWLKRGLSSLCDLDGNYCLVLSMGLPYVHDNAPQKERCWKLIASVIEKSKIFGSEKNESALREEKFIGRRVKHKDSSEGTIVEIRNNGDRNYVCVQFDWMSQNDLPKPFAYPDSIDKFLFFIDDRTEPKGQSITDRPDPETDPVDPETGRDQKQALATLKKYFGYESFKEGQERAITSILKGCDTLAIMPTGAGKSICYQIPALLMDGITIVVSPLIALMQDQVKALADAGVPAAFINSSLPNKEIDEIMYFAQKGRYKLLYVAPERLENNSFLHIARRLKINMVVVDEAHCISQWGQDFRPSYLKIIRFIKLLDRRPCISAFTATATEEVKNDIICILDLQTPEVVLTGFDRPNLFYRVEQIKGKNEFIDKYLKEHHGDSGIIYCATRRNVDELHQYLLDRGYSVTKYHAGIDNETRKNSQNDFIYERSNVIIATNAFGMGIDKSNVRFVIHYNMPQSMENYYQEAGRAGRDSAPAECILLYSPKDLFINKFILDNKEFPELDKEEAQFARDRDRKRLRDMEFYSTSGDCLRNYIRRYFGEDVHDVCGNCGNCRKDFKEVDMTAEAKSVANCVWETRGRYGVGIVVGALKGANRARLREVGAINYKSYGALRNYSEETIKKLILKMIELGYLYRTNDQYQLIQLGNIEPLKDDATRVKLRVNQTPLRKAATSKPAGRYMELSAAGYDLLDRLKGLRTQLARQSNLPPYIVFTDKALIDMCRQYPLNDEEFLRISGVGESKLEKYGEVFLNEIRTFVEENPKVRSVETGSQSGSVEGYEKRKGKEKPPSAGASWTPEEDERLRQEYESGRRISDIANMHGRTYGAIRSRLKKFGLID